MSIYSHTVSIYSTLVCINYRMLETGDCYLKMDDYKKAKTLFLLAYWTDPQSVDTNYNLAVLYGVGEEMELAEVYLRHTLEINPSHVSGLMGLASILSDSEESSRHEEAFLL